MALIQCQDCGKSVSDRAEACIHCGCPIALSIGNQDHNSKVQKAIHKQAQVFKPTRSVPIDMKTALFVDDLHKLWRFESLRKSIPNKIFKFSDVVKIDNYLPPKKAHEYQPMTIHVRNSPIPLIVLKYSKWGLYFSDKTRQQLAGIFLDMMENP